MRLWAQWISERLIGDNTRFMGLWMEIITEMWHRPVRVTPWKWRTQKWVGEWMGGFFRANLKKCGGGCSMTADSKAGRKVPRICGQRFEKRSTKLKNEMNTPSYPSCGAFDSLLSSEESQIHTVWGRRARSQNPPEANPDRLTSYGGGESGKRVETQNPPPPQCWC